MFFVRFNCFPKQSRVFIFKFHVYLCNLFFVYFFFDLQHLLYIILYLNVLLFEIKMPNIECLILLL